MANIMGFFLVLLSLTLSLYPSCALYEDQVGIMDWHQQYIGKVNHAVFHTQKQGRKRVVVATDENIIASLDLRRGDIFWRHVLGDSDAVNDIDIALGKYVITLSSSGSILRAWNLPDGQMMWESFLQGSGPSKSLLSVSASILVFSGGCLHAISGIDGDVLWRRELSGESLEMHKIRQSPNGETIYAAGLVGSSQLALYELNPKNGDIVNHKMALFSGGFSGEMLFLSDGTLVALDATRSTIVTASFNNGNLVFHQRPIIEIVPEFSGSASLLPSRFKGSVAIKTDSHVLLILVRENGKKMETLDKIEGPSAISDALLFSEDQQAFGVVRHEQDVLSLSIKLDGGGNNELITDNIKVDGQRGRAEMVFINNYIRTDRSQGFRALVVMEDYSLMLLQQGNIVWCREDGLASIVDTTISELPLEKEGVSVANVEHSLFQWLKGHFLKLKETLMLASAEDIAVIQEMRLKNSEKTKMTRDHNGFRKLLIVLTRAGKILALHTGDGRVVWSLLSPSFRKSEKCQNPTGVKIYQWQVPHHHALDENPSVLVVGRCGLGSPNFLSFVDSYTGKELESLRLTHPVTQVVPLPFTDSLEQRLHLFVDGEKRAHLHPRSSESLGVFLRELPNIYLYSIDSERGIIRGYGLKGKCIREEGDDYCFETRELWKVVFPLESEKISAVATRKSNEVVHTQAKVLTDQDVIFKYISRNVLFVATVAPKATDGIGSITPDEAWLVAYLIDTVTGRILHRVTHLGAHGPIQAVFSENWVVYHYFNLRAHKYEMSVIEIYDQSRADNKDVLKLVLGKHNLTTPVSSYSRPEVMVKSQSYFFMHSVKSMAVTSTAKGITSKQLLIGTIGDQVLALDKRYVDPRRTINPTQAEKEEGIIPLTDSLPIIPQSYVTHSVRVEGLRGIETFPAKLESTSLVFIYGVDLFYTRIAPSRTYDSLTEEFSYSLLLITIVALVAAIFITWRLSEKKELRDKWR
ncbi:hypothetical protein AMTRI_Chr05g57370 [Amborella trichopoda]